MGYERKWDLLNIRPWPVGALGKAVLAIVGVKKLGSEDGTVSEITNRESRIVLLPRFAVVREVLRYLLQLPGHTRLYLACPRDVITNARTNRLYSPRTPCV